MLQKIRDKITGWFAAVFLGAIAIVFIFWGIQFESSVTAAAAKVNGEEISMQAVQRAWQDRQNELQQVLRDELPESLVKTEQQRLLEDFIRRELLVQRAAEAGFRVSDADLVEAIAEIPALQVDGRFSRDRYAAVLRSQGRTETQFENDFRRDLEVSQLSNGIGVSAFALPGELNRRIALEGETRDVEYAVLPAAGFAAGAEVTPGQVAAWYEKNAANLRTPEAVDLQYVRLDLADVEAGVEVTEDALREFYAQVAPERYVSTERRRARHILIEAGADDAAAREKAEQLATRAKGGEDFAALATENSEDPGSKGQGGDLGWATRESFVAPFSEALFAMAPGEVRGPVQTQFGYHVIRLEEVDAAHQRSFEEVRDELEADFRRERAQARFYEQSQALADEAFASLSELDSVAGKLGLTVQSVQGFTRQGGGPPFGAEQKVIDAAFSDEVLQERQNSPAISLGEESVIVLRVTDHQPPAQRPLEEVRAEIEATLRNEAARQAAEAAAKAAVERLAAGGSLSAIATEVGAQTTGPSTFSRGDEAIPLELRKAVFLAPAPAQGQVSHGTAVLANGDAVVFAVKAVRAGSISPEVAAQFAESAQRAAQQTALAEFAAYVAELERNAKVTRNSKVFE
ncbi:MAG: peptidyl-prolyl cis-trans isomerase [Pseudomonadota bacterium]|nr:peptidyl-prolyl cis-trans isomerase [Pseudomonadota bacterium]